MIGKNEQVEDDNNTNESSIKIINEKTKFIQDSSAKVQEEVRLCFEQLAKILRSREQQILNEIESVCEKQSEIVISNFKAVPLIPELKIANSQQRDLEASILNFGELNLIQNNYVTARDSQICKIKDHKDINEEHVVLDESFESQEGNEDTIDVAERLDCSVDSPCETSFNTSSEADVTLENEITVLINEEYLSPSSDGLRNNNISPELLSNNSNTKLVEDHSYHKDTTDNKLLNNSSESELKKSDDSFGINRGCAVVPEEKMDPITEKFDSINGENICNFAESGSPLEILEKSGDTLIKNKATDCDKHPKQIQQWLQQILVETETEPTIHEIEQFAEISKSRFKEFQFPLET